MIEIFEWNSDKNHLYVVSIESFFETESNSIELVKISV